VYSVLNLLSLYHDSILDKASTKPPHDGSIASTFNRYTRYLVRGSKLFRNLAYTLSVLENVEVLLEMMIIKRFGQKKKWKWITIIELIKYCYLYLLLYYLLIYTNVFRLFLRLSLLNISKNKTLIWPCHPERQRQPVYEVDEPSDPNNSWTGDRIRVNHPTISSMKNSDQRLDIQGFLVSKVLNPHTARRPQDLVRNLKGIGLFAEYLFLLRPISHILLIRKFGLKSWKPWLITILMDLMSRLMSNSNVKSTGGFDKLTILEKEERRRRLWLFGYYLLKNPFYEVFTKYRLLQFIDSTRDRAILGFFSNMLTDYLPLWENYFFYTSAS
jgi:peroxin-16